MPDNIPVIFYIEDNKPMRFAAMAVTAVPLTLFIVKGFPVALLWQRSAEVINLCGVITTTFPKAEILLLIQYLNQILQCVFSIGC